MTRAVLSVGSNVGDRVAHLQSAVDGLGPFVRAVSPVFETAPWGPIDQDDYLNAVILVDDGLAEDGLAEDGLAEDGLAQDGLAENDGGKDDLAEGDGAGCDTTAGSVHAVADHAGSAAAAAWVHPEVTVAGPEAWLHRAHLLEQAAGRVRTVRYGPRTLDVDVVTVEGVRSEDPRLTLPHPRAHERAFVLVPWLAVSPQAVLSGHGTVAELVAGLPAQETVGVRRRDDLTLTLLVPPPTVRAAALRAAAPGVAWDEPAR